MVYLVMGRNGSGKTDRLNFMIDDLTKDTESVLIVPEQCSFTNEKRLLQRLGAKEAANIRVLSFRRLCRLIFDTYHGHIGKPIDDGTKAVLMSMAISQCMPKLKLYAEGERNSKRTAELIEPMLSAVNEYKSCDISPEQLLNAAGSVKDKNLSFKLHDSAIIYEAYNSILGDVYADPDDDLKKTAHILTKNPFFKGKNVFIDSFNGFSAQEMNVIRIIMRQAENTVITLCCDRSCLKNRSSIFAEPNETYNSIISFCSSENIPVSNEFCGYSDYYKSDSLLAIEDGLFATYRIGEKGYLRPEKFKNDGSVVLYEGTDIYDEVQFIAQRIFELVSKKGLKYSDIEIIGRDTEPYKAVFASEFPKYNIPYFLSSPESLESKHLIKFIISAFAVVNSNFDTESVLRMVKTKLTGITPSETDLIEEYCYVWDIRGKRWCSPFTMDPEANRQTKGNDEKEQKEKEKDIEKVEGIRKKIVDPLLEFENDLKNASDGAEITAALYKLMKKYNCSENFKKLCSIFSHKMDDVTLSRETSVWDICMDILSNMYKLLKGKPIDSRGYVELLKIYLKNSPISDIPRTINSVTVSNAGIARSNEPKVVFAIGANEGVFPAMPFDTGIFTDSERRMLSENNDNENRLPLRPSVFGNSLKEKLNVYMTLTAPSEKLFITRHTRSISGDSFDPSIIFYEIKLLLSDEKDNDKKEETDPREKIFYTEKQSFELCAREWNNKNEYSDTLKSYFSENPKYDYRVDAIKKAADKSKFAISDKKLAKQLYGDNMYLSSTKIEKFYECRFSYFCEYGLKINTVKKCSYDHSLFGTAMHFIFEYLFKEKGINVLKSLSNDDLKKEIDSAYELFTKEIGDAQERGGRFRSIGKRIKNHAFLVLSRMCKQFEKDQFTPVGYELHIGGDPKEDNRIDAYEIKLPSGENVRVTGYVDRIDTCKITNENDDKTYIRIIDYKTKSKTDFSLGELTYGQKLQMFIYLYAILEHGAEKYKNGSKELVPAGVLYVPSIAQSGNMPSASAYEKEHGNEEINKNLKMKGLLLADKNVLEKMEPELKGEFIPAAAKADDSSKKKKKDDAVKGPYDIFNSKVSSVATREEFDYIFKYVKKKIEEMAEELYDGSIEVNPTKDACTFCEFSSVCRIESTAAKRSPKKPDKKIAVEEMKKELEDKNKEDNKNE